MVRRSIAFAVATLATITAAAAENTDPTFNGTVVGADCYVRTLTVCRETSCQQIIGPCVGDQCGTLLIAVARGEYMVDSGSSKPIQFTEVSPAELGKPLWLVFKVDLGHDIGNATLSLRPDKRGGYVTTASIFVDLKPPNGMHSFGIENLECQRHTGAGQ